MTLLLPGKGIMLRLIWLDVDVDVLCEPEDSAVLAVVLVMVVVGGRYVVMVVMSVTVTSWRLKTAADAIWPASSAERV